MVKQKNFKGWKNQIDEESTNMKSHVSVIVPAHNARRFIRECLSAIFEQEPAPEEVIVVDDNSSDDTAKIAAEMGAEVLHVSQNLGPSHARNLGARKADQPILFFVDAVGVVVERNETYYYY